MLKPPRRGAILAAASLASILQPTGRRVLAGCIPVYESFAPVSGLSAPTSLVIADVNGDGLPDILAVTSGRLVVSLNDGAGHFQAPIAIAAGDERIVVADFDGDGRPDVAFANGISNAVEVLAGNGDGTFRAAATFSTVDAFTWDVAAGDFDGDGATDLAILLGGAVEVHLQRNGSLTPEGVRSAAFGEYLWALDLDGDGHTDLLVGHSQFGGSSLGSYRSLGNGSFGPWLSGVTAGGYHLGYELDSGDLSGDASREIVVVNSGNGLPASLHVFRGGSGEFTQSGSLLLEGTPSGVAVVDFEGAGHPDVVVLLFTPNGTANLVVYRELDARRLFLASHQRLLAHGSFAFADFDGDGVLDLLVWSSDDVYSPYLMRGACREGLPQSPVTGNPSPVFRRPVR